MFDEQKTQEQIGKFTLSLTQGGFSNSTDDTFEVAVKDANGRFVNREVVRSFNGDMLSDDVVGYAEQSFVDGLRAFLKSMN